MGTASKPDDWDAIYASHTWDKWVSIGPGMVPACSQCDVDVSMGYEIPYCDTAARKEIQGATTDEAQRP